MVRRIVPYLRSKHLQLLVSLIALVMISPFFEGTRLGHLVFNILLSTTLLAGVNVMSESRRIKIAALALAILAAVLIFSDPVTVSLVGTIGFMLCAFVVIVTITLVLRRIVRATTVDFDLLCDGVAVYLLLGLAWALVFICLDTFNPGSFETAAITVETGWADYLYFSLATLTTTGYGDITPATHVARIWAAMEAVTGVLYIAVLVARLVSIYRD